MFNIKSLHSLDEKLVQSVMKGNVDFKMTVEKLGVCSGWKVSISWESNVRNKLYNLASWNRMTVIDHNIMS